MPGVPESLHRPTKTREKPTVAADSYGGKTRLGLLIKRIAAFGHLQRSALPNS
jgi:hypothetical protein